MSQTGQRAPALVFARIAREPVENRDNQDPVREVLVNRAEAGAKELDFKGTSEASAAEGPSTTVEGCWPRGEKMNPEHRNICCRASVWGELGNVGRSHAPRKS